MPTNTITPALLIIPSRIFTMDRTNPSTRRFGQLGIKKIAKAVRELTQSGEAFYVQFDH
jgi:hypothetical protein